MKFSRITASLLLPAALVLSSLGDARSQSSSPKSGGTLQIAQYAAPPSPLDMVSSVTAGVDYLIGRMVYDTLYTQSADGSIANGLATDTQVSPDGLVWNITVKTGVKFHDGTAFDAAAVKSNLDVRKAKKAFRFNTFLQDVQSVDVVSPTEVKLTLSKPNNLLKTLLTSAAFGMQSPTAMEKYPTKEGYEKNASGTGPFKLEAYTPNSTITLVNNPDYWGKKAYLDKVVFTAIPNDASRSAAIKAGNIDATDPFLPPSEFESLKASSNVKVLTSPQLSTVDYLWVNSGKPPFQDPRVRQALTLALDLDGFLKQLPEGLGKRLNSLVSNGLTGVAEQTPYTYDLEQAKQLLAAAGVAPGTEIKLLARNQRTSLPNGQLIKAALDGLGFNVTLQQVSSDQWDTYKDQTSEQTTWNLAVLGSTAPYEHVMSQMARRFLSSEKPPNGDNIFHYNNPEVDELIGTVLTSPTPQESDAALKRMQEIVWNDRLWIPLLAYPRIGATTTAVDGITFAADGSMILSYAWMQ